MQTKDQGRRPKDWKVVAAIATASALGLSGLALAGSNEGSSNPDPINLRDRTSISQVTTPSSVPTTIAGLLDLGADSSLDSPFDDSPDTAPAPGPSPAADSLSADSPAPAPAPAADSSFSADSGSFSNSFSADSS